MKKITLLLLTLIFTWQVNAQFGCGNGVVLTNGYTANGITTPGNGGLEDWNVNPTDTAPVNGFYWDDDVYLFQYTAGAANEEISMTIFSINSWNGIGIFSTCNGNSFSGKLDAKGATGANTSKTVSANIAANQTVYIAVGQWGTPDGLNFNVTNFSAVSLVNPPNCTSVSTPINGATNVSSSVISWTAPAGGPTGYKLKVGTTTGGTDVLNNIDVGNVLTYNLGALNTSATYFVTVTSYNPNGSATGCTESSFTTCGPQSTPFNENFETITAGVPGCWGLAGTTTNATYHFASVAAGNTGRGLRFDSYLNPDGLTSELTTPTLNASANTTLRLKFYFKNPTGGNFEVLVSNNGGLTYTSLENNLTGITAWTLKTYDITSSISNNIKIMFKGTSNYGNGDAYVYLDDVVVEAIPSSTPACVTNIVATPHPTCGNFVNTITWNAATGADSYAIRIGTTAAGTDIANNITVGGALTYSFTGNTATTYYYSIIPTNVFGTTLNCPELSFTTNANGCYCPSTPLSVDDSGITNVQVGTIDFPNTVTSSPVYNNHTATPVNMIKGSNNNVKITFNTLTYDYNTVIWIDYNDNFTLEASEIVFTGLSALTSPNILNASFLLPASTPIGQHRMRIVATDNPQSPQDACYSDAYGETADFTINVVEGTCTPPAAMASIVPDCANLQYSINVDVTSLGSGSPSISYATNVLPITAVGIVTVGPFANGSSVTLTLQHGSDTICDVALGAFTYSCPPANDECSGAIALTMNPDLSCALVTAGTLTAATASNVDVAACFGNENNDVWFSFVATATNHSVKLLDVSSSTDMYHSLWTGIDCTTLTLVEGSCSDNDTSNPSGLIIGNTYFIRVNSYFSGAETTTFNVCVGTNPPAPENDACESAFTANMPYNNSQDATSATNNSDFIMECTGGMNDGVWYTVVGNGGDITINVTEVVDWDAEIGVYTGSCGTFNCEGSVDNEGTDGDETYTIIGSTVGTVYYINIGHYSGFTNNPEGAFTIDITSTLSTSSFDTANFTYYPNPVKDVITLSYNQNISQVEVYSVVGQKMTTNSFDATTAQLDFSNYASGIYLVKVTSNNTTKTIRVIKE